MADAAVFIEQVRALGVQIALEDFGADASSFGYLRTLKVDVLKIDGRFIRNVVDDPLDDSAVRCFVDVARLVGKQCRPAQGFNSNRPLLPSTTYSPAPSVPAFDI